jgi:hypothetical protein
MQGLFIFKLLYSRLHSLIRSILLVSKSNIFLSDLLKKADLFINLCDFELIQAIFLIDLKILKVLIRIKKHFIWTP